MSQYNNQNGIDKNSIFSFLYRNRLKVTKGDVVIVNLSVLFSLLSLLCAPWLVVIGALVALALGYRFAMEKNSAHFGGTFETVTQGMAGNVKSAVESFTHANDETDAAGNGQDGDR